MLAIYKITKEFFHEKTRAILTILAIAWGTFSIAIMLAIGEGIRLNFMQTMANSGNMLLAIYPGATSKSYRSVPTNIPTKLIKQDAANIAKLPNIDKVSIQYEFQATARYRDKESFVSLRAISPECASILNIRVNPKQRFISALDMQKRNKVVVIGDKEVDKLFSKENPVGNTILIDNIPFVIIGVTQKKPQLETADIPESYLYFIPSSTYELLNNPDKVDSIVVSYKNLKNTEQTKNTIQKTIAISHGVDPNDPGIINFVDIASKRIKINKFFINMQIFLGIVGGLTLLLAGVGIANVMYASVKRSTRQIGIQIALGATSGYIISRYLMESLIATIIGGLVGMILAIVFVNLVRFIPLNNFLLEEVFGKPEPVLSFLVSAIIVIVLGAVGFLAGLFPALKAAKIDPSEALNYE